MQVAYPDYLRIVPVRAVGVMAFTRDILGACGALGQSRWDLVYYGRQCGVDVLVLGFVRVDILIGDPV